MQEQPRIEPPGDEVDDLRQLVRRAVESLVDTPDDVEVGYERFQDEFQFTVRVAAGEAGQVIGKRGRNFHALRELTGCVAAKYGLRARIDIEC